MAVLVCQFSCSHLSATTAVFCAKRLVSHHIDSAVAFTYSARSPLRLFGCFFFMLTFSATEQRFCLGWRGWGRSLGDDTGLDGCDRLVTSAL